MIVNIWLSEGFLKVVTSKSLEDVAREYIQDLKDRNLVQVYSESYSGEIKTCQMHDVLRELALREAQRENLLYNKEYDVMSLKHRRINYSPKAQQWITQSRICSSHHLDPFNFSSIFWLSCKSIFKVPSIGNFKLLRVLVLVLVEIDNTSILRQIMSLIHLRFLRFETNLTIHDLPWFMLWNLKILRVGALIECEEKPFGIWGLPQVRHLYFDSIYSLVPPRSIQETLQSIGWLDYRSCTKELFMRTPNLIGLRVHDLEENQECRESNWFENLAYLYQLQKLKIHGNIISWGFRTIDSRRMLSLENFLPNLKTLKLIETKLEWKDMDVIGTLPKLEFLKLNNAVDGPKWEPRDGRFHRLKHLLIHDSDLKCWEATGDHFPILECLVLHWCNKLEKIPSGFADITTLQLIELRQCSDSSITSVEQIRDVQVDSGNNAFILHYDRIPRFEEGEGHWFYCGGFTL